MSSIAWSTLRDLHRDALGGRLRFLTGALEEARGELKDGRLSERDQIVLAEEIAAVEKQARRVRRTLDRANGRGRFMHRTTGQGEVVA